MAIALPKTRADSNTRSIHLGSMFRLAKRIASPAKANAIRMYTPRSATLLAFTTTSVHRDRSTVYQTAPDASQNGYGVLASPIAHRQRRLRGGNLPTFSTVSTFCETALAKKLRSACLPQVWRNPCTSASLFGDKSNDMARVARSPLRFSFHVFIAQDAQGGKIA